MPEEVISDQVPFDGQNIHDAAIILPKFDVPAEEREDIKKAIMERFAVRPVFLNMSSNTLFDVPAEEFEDIKKAIMEELAMSSKTWWQRSEPKILPKTIVDKKWNDTRSEELMNVFNYFDANGDGIITHADLAQGHKTPISFKLGYRRINFAGLAQHLAQKFDADGDGRISKTEFDRIIKELLIDDDNGVIYSNADDRFVEHFKNGQLFAPHVEWGRTYPALSIFDVFPQRALPAGDVQGRGGNGNWTQNMCVSAHATGRYADYCVIENRDSIRAVVEQVEVSIRALADKFEACREEDPKFPKLAKTFLILAAEKAAFLLGTSSTRGSSPSAKSEGLFYFTIACDTVGVFTSLAAIYMHRKMPKASGILENIAGFSFVLGFFGMMAEFLA